MVRRPEGQLGLFRPYAGGEAGYGVRDTLSELGGASDLFSDRVRVEDNSGHSFFRRLLNRTAELFQLDERRSNCRETFTDLFSLAEAGATQAASETNLSVQHLSVEVAENSRLLTRNTLIMTAAALLITAVQLFVSLRGGGSESELRCSEEEAARVSEEAGPETSTDLVQYCTPITTVDEQ